MPTMGGLRAVLTTVCLLVTIEVTWCKSYITNEQRLHHYLMVEKKYNKLIRPPGVFDPVRNQTNILMLKLGMQLSQIIDVSEKNQILTTSVWVRHEWIDKRIVWNPHDFGGLKFTHIPSEDLWKPDIVLYNNADGTFNITMKTKATVFYTGLIIWEPPAIYKSYCPINVEFWPFDQQECFMKFGCWTHDGNDVDLRHILNDKGIDMGNKTLINKGVDLCDYYPNVEWDIINVTATRKIKVYPCCPEPYIDITFNITIRRKTLFHTVNLILPMISISTLTVLVFYLPSDSCEKITLSISILLALTVFFLLLSDINPPTSLVIPLLGKYLLFTMIVVTMSIFLTVYTLSVRFRSPSTHVMSPWIKRVFTEILPKILCMERPEMDKKEVVTSSSYMDANEMYSSQTDVTSTNYENTDVKEICNISAEELKMIEPASPNYENIIRQRTKTKERSIYFKESVKGVKFIRDHLKKADEESSEERDWNYVAMVMDRLFLYIFSTACVCGTIGIFLNAPSLYDHRLPMSTNDFDCSKKEVDYNISSFETFY